MLSYSAAMPRCFWVLVAWASVWVGVASPTLAQASEASEDVETHAVVVVGGDVGDVAGAKLVVLKHTPEVNGLRKLNDLEPTFDAAGRCEVALPPGRYAFEVLHRPNPDTVVALRTGTTWLRRAKTVEIEANPAVPLRVTAEGAAVDVDVLSVRSAALEGALLCEAEGRTLSLVLSPRQRYQLGVLAHHDATRYAFWMPARTDKAHDLALPVERARRVTVAWRDGTTQRNETEPAHVAFFFPDSRLRVEVSPDLELLTNRRYVELTYSYPTHDGGRLYFHKHGYRLDRDTTAQIGGPLTAHAYVGVHRHYNGEYDSRLAHEFWIDDPGGHTLDLKASKVQHTRKLVRVDGEPLPPNPLTPGSLDLLRPLSEHFRVEVSYTLGETVEASLVPEEPVEMKSRHFTMQAVPGWAWRSQMYLLRAERAYELLKPISVNPGSSQVRIGWLTNDHRARGGWRGKRVGAKRGFINMPFLRYRQCFDAFGHTNFLTHEVLHTYGYAHGDVMRAAQREGERRFREFRWHVADQPNFVPDGGW